MASLVQIPSDVNITGTLTPRSINLPSGCVVDDDVSASADISASKLEHQYQRVSVLCDHATSAAAKRQQIHRVYGATGTILEFGVAASVAATSTGAAVINLYKNGSTILSATITLDSATAAFTLKEPSGFTSTALVAGDVLEAAIDSVSGSAVPKGVSCHLALREDAA